MVFLLKMCYDLYGDSMEIELKLIPINEKEDSKNIINIPLKKVEYLAFLATNLTPHEEFTEIDGYTSALWEEMQIRKYNDKDLFALYDKLIHATNGFNLLKIAVQLFLMEKDMRNYGTSKDLMAKYDILQKEYQAIISELKI